MEANKMTIVVRSVRNQDLSYPMCVVCVTIDNVRIETEFRRMELDGSTHVWHKQQRVEEDPEIATGSDLVFPVFERTEVVEVDPYVSAIMELAYQTFLKHKSVVYSIEVPKQPACKE